MSAWVMSFCSDKRFMKSNLFLSSYSIDNFPSSPKLLFYDCYYFVISQLYISLGLAKGLGMEELEEAELLLGGL